MEELRKLEEYLKANHYQYDKVDHTYDKFEEHQIIVYKNRVRSWDAIWSTGSYGFNNGLLEISGAIVPPGVKDSVEGNLTAEAVIERINKFG